jgi:hypothetical protein
LGVSNAFIKSDILSILLVYLLNSSCYFKHGW